MVDRLADLSAAGVAVWLDDISRERLTTGGLDGLRRDQHVVGVTSNPTIFAKALADSDDYAEQVADLALRGVAVEEATRMITTYDVRWACDVMRPAYHASAGVDGRVSIEVDPRLAHDTDKTAAEAKQLWWLVDRPNLYIKIPATQAGLPAITATLAAGISVNVTLIFGLDRYDDVINAFMTGLEQAKANGHDLSIIGSVASFFVSRVDTEIDKRLDRLGTEPALALRGKAAVANAQLAYQRYEKAFASDRWQALAAAGARPQRPLWASTSTKNPDYRDVIYVEELIAPGVVNTMPEPVIHAFADHGELKLGVVQGAYAQAQQLLDRLAVLGIDYDDVIATLEREGVDKFEASWLELLKSVETQLGSYQMSEVEAAAGLAVRGADEVPGALDARRDLADAGVPGLLAQKDPTLWGAEAEAEVAIRLGWVDTFRRSRDLLPALAELKAEIGDLDHVVLAGMGGSSLAPEVIARTLGLRLTVLDTTDPHQVRTALADRLERTVVVVASKSGSTVETDSHRRAYWQAFTDAGIADVGRHFVIVTDPGSPLEATARDMGAHVFLADPDVGGRYSALTAFGMVPSALAGVKVAELLEQAEEFARSLAADDHNPALALGAALGAAAKAGRDKVALIDDGSGITGLGDWAEQLIAESTGKNGVGILPVVVETPTSPGATGDDVVTVTLGGGLAPATMPGSGVIPHIAVNGPLGAQFLVWEAATALAGRVLGINPFDQPNVTESKANTTKILASGLPLQAPLFREGAIEVYGDALGGATTVAGALRWLVGEIGPTGYLAAMAYLDRFGDAKVADVRPILASASGRPVTFGWGPRFLHSTGQYHKGGPQVGAYMQLTGAVTEDLDVPGQPYTFGQLQAAQAAGDRQALTGRGRPLLWLHLTDRSAGVAELLAAAESLGAGH